MPFGIGPAELLVIGVIVLIFAAPFVAAGVVIWLVLKHNAKRPPD